MTRLEIKFCSTKRKEMLNNLTKVQNCDAGQDDNSNEAGDLRSTRQKTVNI